MNKQFRGRPKLPLTVRQVLGTVRNQGTVTAAGRELGCSPAYVYALFNELGLTLAQVLVAPGLDDLLRPRRSEDLHDTEH